MGPSCGVARHNHGMYDTRLPRPRLPITNPNMYRSPTLLFRTAIAQAVAWHNQRLYTYDTCPWGAFTLLCAGEHCRDAHEGFDQTHTIPSLWTATRVRQPLGRVVGVLPSRHPRIATNTTQPQNQSHRHASSAAVSLAASLLGPASIHASVQVPLMPSVDLQQKI